MTLYANFENLHETTGIPKSTLTSWIKAGKLKPALKSEGGRYYYAIADIRELCRQTIQDDTNVIHAKLNLQYPKIDYGKIEREVGL